LRVYFKPLSGYLPSKGRGLLRRVGYLDPSGVLGGGEGDGYFTDGSVKICTDNFTKDEVLRLIEVLHVKYGIKASINKRTNLGGSVK
jgi:LAGLIDADG DNA endonuclease family protein